MLTWTIVIDDAKSKTWALTIIGRLIGLFIIELPAEEKFRNGRSRAIYDQFHELFHQ